MSEKAKFAQNATHAASFWVFVGFGGGYKGGGVGVVGENFCEVSKKSNL